MSHLQPPTYSFACRNFATAATDITYAKPWFIELNNVGLDKSGVAYQELPELLREPAPRSGRKATQRS